MSRSYTSLSEIDIARAKVMNNDKDINLHSLNGYVCENRARSRDGLVRRCMGEVLLNMDDQHISEAKDWIEKAIEKDKRNGTVLYLGWDYVVYAELFKRKGDQSRAKENLNKAIEILKSCGADGWVEKADKELASLS